MLQRLYLIYLLCSLHRTDKVGVPVQVLLRLRVEQGQACPRWKISSITLHVLPLPILRRDPLLGTPLLPLLLDKLLHGFFDGNVRYLERCQLLHGLLF